MIENFNPLVTIIIPVFNGSNYLRDAIDSALAQTYENIEILVVNDGSIDEGKTREIALSYSDKIKYFEKENGGVASALNVAIENMHGDYFSWLSHDDVYYANKIEKQINYLTNNNKPNVILFSDYDIIDNNGKYICSRAMPDIIHQDFRLWITIENILHGCTLLIPKECFIRCGRFNESLKTTQDYDLWFRLAEYYDFIRVPETLVKSRYHSEQTTKIISSKVIEECNLLMISFCEQLKHHKYENNIVIANSFYRRGFFLSSYVAYKKIFNNTPWLSLRKKIGYITMILKSLLKMLLQNKYLLKYLFHNKSNKRKFTYYYHSNTFKSNESKSGEGSTLEQTKNIRESIPVVIKDFGISVFIDAPCGDFNWMQYVDMDLLEKYYGIDIVEDIIENNKVKYANEKIEFLNMDIANDPLPKGDLILCRDCLVHLTFRDGIKAIRNFKNSKINYLLTTTFVDRELNNDLKGNDVWRTLNMQLPPFNFPKPLVIINEGCTEGDNNFRDKSLALYKLEDITI